MVVIIVKVVKQAATGVSCRAAEQTSGFLLLIVVSTEKAAGLTLLVLVGIVIVVPKTREKATALV